MDDLARLVSERACERLLADYFNHLTSRDCEAVASLFAADAEVVRTGSLPFHLQGRQAIVDFVKSIPGQGLRVYVALNLQVSILNPSTAEGGCLGVVLAAEDGSETGPPVGRMTSMVRYRDVFRHGPSGWCFTRREITPLMTFQ